MTRPLSVRPYRTALALCCIVVLPVLCITIRADDASPSPQMIGAAGPAGEPADLLSREYGTGNWFGLRELLKKYGIALDLEANADYSHNFQGGLRRGDAFRYILNFNLVVETEPLLGIKGGTFFVGAQNHSGKNGTGKLTGDVQGFDNIDAPDFTQLSELWYEQKLFEDKLRIKIGKFDANTEFAAVEYAGEFIHSSPGFGPTILGFPSYPDPATSVAIFAQPLDDWYLGAGLFDGATQDGRFGRTGNRGPSTFWGEPSDLFLIGETGFNWSIKDSLPGRAGVGLWHHTGTFDRFDGGTQGGTTGVYLVLDQLLWRENPADDKDDQGIGAFFQYGWADPRISAVDHHVGLGLAWSGAIPSRDQDVLGIMASYVHFSNEPGAGFVDDSELAVEAFYRWQLAPWFSIKPDLQYIMNPGGSGLDDALVLTLRAQMKF